MGAVSQQRWVSKLFAYDFTIEYKKGEDDRVVDNLSRKFEEQSMEGCVTISLISFPTPYWIRELQQSYLQVLATQNLLT